MKIKNNNVEVIKELRFDNGKECIEIMDGEYIKVVTDGTEFDKEYVGQFEFVDENHIWVDGVDIPLEYIEEIEVLNK